MQKFALYSGIWNVTPASVTDPVGDALPREAVPAPTAPAARRQAVSPSVTPQTASAACHGWGITAWCFHERLYAS